MVKDSLALKEPEVGVPLRTMSNTKFDKKRRILEMGDAKQQRELFNFGQSRKFMQTILLANGCRELIEADKTLSLRGMFYKTLHTIPGTKEKTFDDQEESDPILEDLEVSLGSLREELHVFAKKAGTMVGNITVVDSGDEIDCRHMGSGGYAIPSIVEPEIVQFKKCDAKFVLHVEKNTVWSRFNEDKFWKTHNCILTEGAGQPPRGVRRLLRRLQDELKLPVYCLLDCDPYGALHLQRHQAGVDQPRLRERAHGGARRQVHRPAGAGLPALRLRATTSRSRSTSATSSAPSRSPPTPGSRTARAGRRRSSSSSTAASRWKSRA